MIDDDNTSHPIPFKAEPDRGTSGLYHILQYDKNDKCYATVGDYTVLDKEEPTDITEKKMINLLALLNKQNPTIDFSSLTNERVLFSMNRNNASSTHQTIVFRSVKNEGMSKENAVLTIKNEALAHIKD